MFVSNPRRRDKRPIVVRRSRKIVWTALGNALSPLVGAFTGLLAQQAAYAAGSHMVKSPMAASQMSEDCMETMREQRPEPAKQPCKGLTLDCIAAMGCVVPVILGDPAALAVAPHAHGPPPFRFAVAVLAGKNLPPEQHPPTILG